MASTPRLPSELDEVTLARARRGDAAAFRTLIEVYGARVHALIYRIVEVRLGVGRAEELTQDTFLRVHGALARFEVAGAARPSSWILTIAARVALNALRDARPSEPLEAAAEVAGDDDAGAALDRARAAARLRRALGRLTPEHRAAIVLREYHDLDYDEIARALEVELGTVKSRLSRARAELRRLLDRGDDDHG
jgi:RNA polymerase sigma-70 factor (ECF subfamily)